MKKHILVLLILLLALIIACVYQKTHALYVDKHGELSNTPLTLVKQTKESTQNTKQHATIMSSKSSAVAGKEAVPYSAEKARLSTQAAEQEVAEYLLSVMKERDIAVAQRDEVETKLHALIKNALEARHLAVEEMHKVSIQIEKEHEARLKARDAQAKNNSEEKGN